MKIALNRCYGVFNLSNFGYFKCKQYGLDTDNIDTLRIDEDFTHLVEVYQENISGNFSLIKVFEISDYATDWKVIECDGFERLIYVVNGKMHTL